MLLPSALPCDGSQVTGAKPNRPLLRRFMPYSGSSAGSGFIPTISTIAQSESLAPVLSTTIASGLPSPLLSPSSISTGIQSTCRALQSLLGVTPASKPTASIKRNKVPLPPTSYRSPLRTVPVQDNRITKKRSTPAQLPRPSRGRNKRTRDEFEPSDVEIAMDIDLEGSSEYASTRDHGYNYDSGYPLSSSSDGDATSPGFPTDIKRYSTPKRRRRLPGPVDLPFGLDRQDFADLEDSRVTFCTPQSTMTHSSRTTLVPHNPSKPAAAKSRSTTNEDEDEDWWTPVDDAQLVTLVLEKMKLSHRDWEECAKILGAEGEGGSLGKRWRWLMGEGKVGLKAGIANGGRFEGRRTSRRQGRGDIRTMF